MGFATLVDVGFGTVEVVGVGTVVLDAVGNVVVVAPAVEAVSVAGMPGTGTRITKTSGVGVDDTVVDELTAVSARVLRDDPPPSAGRSLFPAADDAEPPPVGLLDPWLPRPN